MSGQLTEGFRELIELRWSEFVEREESLDATNFDSIITAIGRAASKSNLRAIQAALDRLDGKVAIEVGFEYPKFYTLYPYATKTADDPDIIEINESTDMEQLRGREFKGVIVNELVTGSPADIDELAAIEEEIPTGSLRVMLEKMLNSPKSIVSDILAAAAKVDAGDFSSGDPMVKSVIVAGLMKLVHEGRISAVFEVFDQIDGKVAEKIRVLGADVHQIRYDTIAPAGAVKNEDGIYQVEAENTTAVWTARLEALSKGRR